uniref:Uncharacterized protein n=1 Tax=Anguilla anguilla TaxID=7936 RepID=A0A0E9UHR1_ANGAN
MRLKEHTVSSNLIYTQFPMKIWKEALRQ